MTTLADRIRYSMNERTQIYSLGQAGFVIKTPQGSLIGIDLYLSECVERTEGSIGYKRLLPKLIEPLDIDLDVLIATHAHFDHYDIDSVPLLIRKDKTVLYASSGCCKYVKTSALEENRVSYVAAGDCYDHGEFTIRFVNCDHGSAAPDAVGVILEVGEKRVYETGDTCLRLDRIDEVVKNGNIDVLIGPINGAYGNMNENDLCALAHNLNPAVVIPCHYGMFASHGGNPGLFLELMRKEGMEDRVRLLGFGEGFEIS